ncbi:Serine/threonine-protein kinase/endoribonuclease IRE1b [Orchesella cincta]|uniref:Serine/threonine-protein kinase/endoribonuclease IRE1b n=1 Tax=Orchesella cincta TaxID=48709 RepID=A0A1D2MFU9_ORCCI|nr:Serine/threonine-protein kinase/endoribonuclease IRE1b [Orchesella cincta]
MSNAGRFHSNTSVKGMELGDHLEKRYRYTVKRLKADHFDIYSNELRLWQEMKKNLQEENVNILQLYKWVEWTDGYLYFSMELASVIWHKNKEHQRHGLKWIHDSQILHRDIKPENILIVMKADGSEIAKIGDFGVSRKLSTMSTGTNSLGKGTSDWMAPEAIRSMNSGKSFKNTKAIDIFSFGMTAQFTLSLGVHPFAESKRNGRFIPMNILHEDIPPATLGLGEYLADHLFQWSMQYDSVKRPNITQVVNHPFFWNPKQSLGFIVDVARTLYNKNNDKLLNLRSKIDQVYMERTLGLNPSLNWPKKMERKVQALLFTQQPNGILKKYRGDSLMMLVELIRDKFMHYTELHVSLLADEYFGEEGTFSEEKYAKYFLKIYPDLVIFLFCFLANEKNSCLRSLQKKYFTHFDNIPLMPD